MNRLLIKDIECAVKVMADNISNGNLSGHVMTAKDYKKLSKAMKRLSRILRKTSVSPEYLGPFKKEQQTEDSH